jgi:hypothetical protein
MPLTHYALIAVTTLSALLLHASSARAELADDPQKTDWTPGLFEKLDALDWQEQFHDPGDEAWQAGWFLDGERGTVKNTPDGMVFSAGPIAFDNGSHAVLWTQDSFEGSIRIDFDYTRLDTISRAVNILYIQATGVGSGPYTQDISEWSDLRIVPFMSSYFNNMNLLHVSFAAFVNDGSAGPADDYIRARRYPVVEEGTFEDTEVEPSYDNTGLFTPGEVLHMTFIKHEQDLMLRVTKDETHNYYHWNLADFPPVTEGRIGIRHMWTRCARYAGFGVSTLNPNMSP